MKDHTSVGRKSLSMNTLNDRIPLTKWIPMLVVSAVLATCFVSQLRADERPSKPNIIIMMADDMGLGKTVQAIVAGAPAPPRARRS